MPVPIQKLYQLIISRLDGHRLSSAPYQEQLCELVRKGIGGFIVFGGGKTEVSSFINRLQLLAETPLFIASDIERGVGQQISGATVFPGQMAVAAATDTQNPGSMKLLEDAIRAVAYESIDIGINMPLIPVMDVNSNPDNPIICSRAFSDKPAYVSRYGTAYIDTLEKTGLISCAKHFPGHGDTAVDSHISLPVISKSIRELNAMDLVPFVAAVKANVSSIMMGHISIPAIDDLPASLSIKAVDLLRTGLGFDGLILTDALNMHALKDIPSVAVTCVNAGIDILLHPENPDKAVTEIHSALEAGNIAEEKIDRAITRILKYKSGIRNLKKSRIEIEQYKTISRTISDRSITLVKGGPQVVPLKNIADVSLFYSADESKHDLSALKAFIPGPADVQGHNGKDLKETVIVALFTKIAAWEGSSGMRQEDIKKIRYLITQSRHSIIISFGNPYLLRHFREADALIAAYDTTGQAQSSVMKALRGDVAFQGRLPVELKG